MDQRRITALLHIINHSGDPDVVGRPAEKLPHRRARAGVPGGAGRGEGAVGVGLSVALPHRTIDHPLYTGCANTFGAPVSGTAVRPSPSGYCSVIFG